MLKRVLFAAAAVSLMASPAFAQMDMKCSKAELQDMQSKAEAMDSGKNKTMASKEVDMAMDMMKKKDMDGCKTHMKNAMDAMKKS